MLSIPLEQRFSYDEGSNHFFVNFERFAIRNQDNIERIRQIVVDRLAPLGKRVYAIVNYDNFTIEPELLDSYSAMVRGLVDKYYAGVTRYTTSGFLRMKLGDALEKRGVAPHIYESATEAEQSLQEIKGEELSPKSEFKDTQISQITQRGRGATTKTQKNLTQRRKAAKN
jgi:propionate CoA-transferase